MKRITFNRILIAIVLVYFPIATLGATGSYWSSLQIFILMLTTLYIGYKEGQQ